MTTPQTPEPARKGRQLGLFAYLEEKTWREVWDMGLSADALDDLVQTWKATRPRRQLAFLFDGVPVVIGYDEEAASE